MTVAGGLYVVTGGLGGLGLRAAALLVSSGVRGVVLASRSGRVVREGTGVEAQLLRSLSEATAAAACDSAVRSDTSALACGRWVAGVLHAAGAGDKGLVMELMAHRVR